MSGEETDKQLPSGDGTKTQLPRLLAYGLDDKVARRLDLMYECNKLGTSDLDERALDALKEFPVDGAINVLTQFQNSNLEHVSNKSAYLCGMMKTYRQKSRSGYMSAFANCMPSTGPTTTTPLAVAKAPDESRIRAILERTQYTLDVTTGQRKYGGPPPDWGDQPPPGPGCEVFCGKIAKNVFEDELIPLFERCGRIWDLRLMMDSILGLNKGYAFVTFTTKEAAQIAVQQLDGYELRPGKPLKINISIPNQRLFVGNIPKSKAKDEIFREFEKQSAGLRDVIIYSSPDDKKKNRGFCFLEYESHKAASLAKRCLGSGRVKVWGCDIIVDWADPQDEPDEATMAKVKVLYVRNLTQECSEDMLRSQFEEFGRIDKVKKIKDYAFVHFDNRDQALEAMNTLQGKVIAGAPMEITLAKPPSDKKRKEDILRAREQRMIQLMKFRINNGYAPAAGVGAASLNIGTVGIRPLPVTARTGMVPGNMGPTGVVSSSALLAPLRSMGLDRRDYNCEYDRYGEYRSGYGAPCYDEYSYSASYDPYYTTELSPPLAGRATSRNRSGRILTEPEDLDMMEAAAPYYASPNSLLGNGMLSNGDPTLLMCHTSPTNLMSSAAATSTPSPAINNNQQFPSRTRQMPRAKQDCNRSTSQVHRRRSFNSSRTKRTSRRRTGTRSAASSGETSQTKSNSAISV